MEKKPTFKDIQHQFTAHMRDPENVPAPANIAPERIKLYSDIIYRNVENFIASGFPVLRKLYNDENWHKMVRNFFVQHKSTSPYFLEISEEFLQYLQNEHESKSYDPKFLLELAHYEWVELALSVADENIDLKNIDPNGDLLSGHPVVSPLAWLLSYSWPVHKLSPDYQPTEPPTEPTNIIVFRDRNEKVRFVLVNPVTARLLYILSEDASLSGSVALQQIVEEMQHGQPEIVIRGGLEAMEQLKSQGIIIGVT